MNDNTITRAKLAERQVNETKILQKVNAANREAFQQKYPQQVEHCLRLVMERLQAGLDKRDGVILDDVRTWKLSPAELYELTDAVFKMYQIREGLKKDANS